MPEPSTFLLLGLGLLGVINVIKRKKDMKSLLLLLLAGLMLGSPVAFAQEEVITITKAGSSGDGTIVFDDYHCEPGCKEFTIPYSEGMGTVLKAISDEDSRFIRWRREDNTPLQGEFQVQPGETLKVLFQNRLELFTDVPGAGTPDLSEPAILRGRYVQVFTELLFEEETIVFNIFEDVSITFVREMLKQVDYDPYENDLLKSYSWIGGPSQKRGWDGTVLTFGKDGSVHGRILFKGNFYRLEKQNGQLAIFEIDTAAPVPVLDIDAEELRQSRKPEAPTSSFAGLLAKTLDRIGAFFVGEPAYAQEASPPIDVMGALQSRPENA